MCIKIATFIPGVTSTIMQFAVLANRVKSCEYHFLCFTIIIWNQYF